MPSMIPASQRGLLWALLAGVVLFAGCGPAPTPKCQASNCSGCCTEENVCIGASKQSFSACGSGAAKCRTCLPQQICSQLRCVAGEGGGAGGGSGGGAGGSGGGVGGGTGGSGGGGAACGASGQACCVGTGTGCLLGLFCNGNVCGTTPPPDGGTGGGSAGGGAGGGGGGGGAGGGGAGGGGAGGGGGTAALGALGDPCVVGSNCASNYCQAFGFQDGYCTNACTTQADCTTGVCGRNPAGGNVCLKSCPTAGLAPGGCRTGYVCEKFQSSLNGTPVCFPACANANTCAGGALVCDSRGFCCGPNGAACCDNTTCDTGGTCDPATKHCKVLPATNRPAGEACTSNTQCVGAICYPELVNSPPGCIQACFAAGYCTQDCTSTGCPTGSSCSLYTFPGAVKRCVSNCAWDGGQGDCRSSYVCDRGTVVGSTQATCYKKCFNDAGCSSVTTCEGNGFCCGAVGFRCCSVGAKCPGGGICNTLDYCQ